MNEIDNLIESVSAKQPSKGSVKKSKTATVTRLFDELSDNAYARILDKLRVVLENKKPYDRENVVMEQLGIKYTTMYYIMAGKRGFPLDRLGEFCARFAHMSCHEIALGEKKPVVLPKTLSYIVKTVMQLDIMRGENDTGFVSSLIDTYKTHIKPVASLPVRPDLCVCRINELADDVQMPPKRAQAVVWGKSNNVALMFRGQQKIMLISRIEENISHVKMTSALMLCFVLDVPLDYLVCEDYTRTCDIAYKDDTGNIIPVTDKDIIRLVSIYLSLPEDMQRKMFTDIALRSTLVKTMFSLVNPF